MRVCCGLACSLLLVAACAAPTRPHVHVSLPQDKVDALLVDQVFPEGSSGVEVAEVDLFDLPASMERYLDEEILPLPTDEERYRALRKWAFAEAGKYEYDPDTTVPISQLEAVGKINCFSFSNLFVAAARHVGLPAQVQLIYSPPDWTISDRTWLFVQHINVTGEFRRTITYGDARENAGLPRVTGTVLRNLPARYKDYQYVVDLNPDVVVDAYRTQILEDHEVLARYFANVGVEALLQEDYAKAYAYTKSAIRTDKYSSPGWNNLGVLYSRIDREDLAQKSFQIALTVDPDADSAMTNLAALYQRMGDEQQAAELDQRLEARRNKNPYYHYYLGEDLLREGKYEESVQQFRKAIRRKEDEQLFYLALVEAQLALNQVSAAEKNLKKAEEHADVDNADRYAQLSREVNEVSSSQRD